MSTQPLYVSPSSAKSLWQEYRVYPNRIELGTMFGTMTIPFEKIERITTSPPLLSQLARGEIFCRDFRPGLKVDWADFTDHVTIDRSDGFLLRRVLVTPDDPPAFVAAIEKAITTWRAGKFAKNEK